MDSLKGKRILVVDDEAALREIFHDELEQHGCQCDEASSGSQAVEKVLRNRYDAIISDVRMPGGDGISLLSSIREAGPLRPLFILMTGYSDYTKAELYDWGADAIFNKPFSMDQILRAVHTGLTNPKARWSHPTSSTESPLPSANVELEVGSIDELRSGGDLRLGRGGIYLGKSQADLRLNEIINFRIRLKDDSSYFLEGAGRCVWMQNRVDTRNGAGIEFVELTEKSIDFVDRFSQSENLIAYIPKV